MARLVMLSGLPGSGKSTLGRELASRTGAILLRIDSFEQDLRNQHGDDYDVGTRGYETGYLLARKHLDAGKSVIADAVNAVEAARNGWRDIARETHADLAEIEIVCSAPDEAGERLRTRDTGIEGLAAVSPEARAARGWEPNPHVSAVIDTAGRSIEDCASDLCQASGLLA